MFESQRQFFPFLDVGRSDDDRFTLSGQKVEEVVAETGALQRYFDKDIFCQGRRKKCQFAFAVCLLHLIGDGRLGQEQVFGLFKEVDCFGYCMTGFVFQGQ